MLIFRTDPQLPALDSTNEAKPSASVEEVKDSPAENTILVEIEAAETEKAQESQIFSRELVDYYNTLKESTLPLYLWL